MVLALNACRKVVPSFGARGHRRARFSSGSIFKSADKGMAVSRYQLLLPFRWARGPGLENATHELLRDIFTSDRLTSYTRLIVIFLRMDMDLM